MGQLARVSVPHPISNDAFWQGRVRGIPTGRHPQSRGRGCNPRRLDARATRQSRQASALLSQGHAAADRRLQHPNDSQQRRQTLYQQRPSKHSSRRARPSILAHPQPLRTRAPSCRLTAVPLARPAPVHPDLASSLTCVLAVCSRLRAPPRQAWGSSARRRPRGAGKAVSSMSVTRARLT